jgi:enamine deaminase RidA (YjgF/YER057c/UK114 family)
MTIKRLGDPTEISDAVIYGNTVYLAGVVPEDPVPASVYDQTKNVLKQIDEVLTQAGTDKTRLLKAQVFLADIKTFDDMHRAWKEWVPKGHAPARATVEAKLVDHPHWGVEIMCEAALK